MHDLPLFPTSLVGSYPQPDWLIDKAKLKGRFPPRTRASELWRVDEAFLLEAFSDAVRLAVEDQIAAGLDIVTDGEACRESYSNHFATALDGVDIDNPGTALDRSGEPVPVHVGSRLVHFVEGNRDVVAGLLDKPHSLLHIDDILLRLVDILSLL